MQLIIDKIHELLQENILDTRSIKRIYKGDPLWIPFNDLPCITVCPISTNPISADNENDNDIYKILICIILDDRTYFNENASEDTGQFALVKIAEERNEDFTLMDNTVLGIINKEFRYDTNYNLKLDNISVNYPDGTQRSQTVRPTSPQDFYPTRECIITFDILGKMYSRN